jgi:hypothetical protein
VHAGGRRKGKGRSRILYWFRTPPGVRVGRAALDEDAIRLIEEHNPDVEFDWTRILKGQGVETTPAPARERDPRFDVPRRPERRPRPEPVEPAVDAELVPPPAEAVLGVEPASELETDAIDRADAVQLAALDDSPVQESGPDEAVHPVTPAHARIGSEGVSRLRARCAEVLARISERTQDSARQEELKALAERLNPDTWVTDGEVTSGLENYEAVFEGLRNVIGGQTRRRRRKHRRGGEQGQPRPAGDAPSGGEGESGPNEDETSTTSNKDP